MTGIRSWMTTCGGDMPAFVAVPDHAAKAPAVIVVHERYGFVRHTRDLAERFARDGLVAVAPDLYFKHPDQEAVHRGDEICDITDPDASVALGAAIDALKAIPQRRWSGTARPSRANGPSTTNTRAHSTRSSLRSTAPCSACSARPII
jgi:dienelactone hydrolase